MPPIEINSAHLHSTSVSRSEILSNFAFKSGNETENCPAPHSAEELKIVVQLAKDISKFSSMDTKEQQNVLGTLEAYECHMQLAQLLQWRIDTAQPNSESQFADYLKLLSTLYLGLERFDDFLEVSKKCVMNVDISFNQFKLYVAEDILGAENYNEQNQLYRTVLDCFSHSADKVLCLERLSLIYEKKLFLESEVEPVFRKILDIDPYNIKALRFYKLWYTQGMRWKDAAEQLEKIIVASNNPHEKQRSGHELAQIYLYNLNKPQQAKDILLEHCPHSALDTRQTLVDALERLNAWDDLLSCLKDAEKGIENTQELAALKLKQGLVRIKAGRSQDAIADLKECIVHHPQQLLAYEALVTALVNLDKVDELERSLEELQKVVYIDSSKIALNGLIARLNEIRTMESKAVH